VILEAKRLLAHSGAQVAQVATQLGFEDPAYFSRCFKKHTGRTPLEFRQALASIADA
jgi:AraC-like DNA-binding protein